MKPASVAYPQTPTIQEARGTLLRNPLQDSVVEAGLGDHAQVSGRDTTNSSIRGLMGITSSLAECRE